MRILAIDPATKLGWASPTSSGMQDFSLRSNESKGLKFVKARAFIKQIIELDKIEIVIYEKPGGAHYNGVRSGANFEGIIMELAESMGLEYKDFSASEIKKHAKVTTNCTGTMNKDMMVQSAKIYLSGKYDVDIIDDNHADALWLYDMFNELVN